ncbi:MAG TPA: TetR/AcrR family transcriptional regulator [Aestuariivirga sp.]|nr:helix-turn-helix transcriptional regulator [Alphaproteobacteria bacterium]HRX34887.1 TetR/AcrR family transcriptional regulator [Aestuariivirga sp.]
MTDLRKPAPKPAKRRRAAAKDDAASKRQARRTRRREQSREEILDAARRVLLRSGVAATTLEAVAKEVGVSKTALYYYFPSKDALLFELIFAVFEGSARTVHDRVERAATGPEALRALIRETVKTFAPRLDDFRLAFLYGQVASTGALHFDAEQFARIRPINDLWLAGAAEKVAQGQGNCSGRTKLDPRLIAFLAHVSAIGLLTMKGLVENFDDPLRYSDEQLIDGFARIFEAAVTG